jgi:ribonuclease HI
MGVQRPHTEDDGCLIAFCDGSALNNGRRGAAGGFAVVWPYHDAWNEWYALPKHPPPTNNRAEFSALIAALRRAGAEPSRPLYVYTDSMLLVNTVTLWMSGWKARGWTKRDGSPVQNLDLVREIDRHIMARSGHLVLLHVKAHTGAPTWEAHYNQEADRLARWAAAKVQGQ